MTSPPHLEARRQGQRVAAMARRLRHLRRRGHHDQVREELSAFEAETGLRIVVASGTWPALAELVDEIGRLGR